jgi:hypothetical protein
MNKVDEYAENPEWLIVKKNAIMQIDFALEASAAESPRSRRSTRAASSASAPS